MNEPKNVSIYSRCDKVPTVETLLVSPKRKASLIKFYLASLCGMVLLFANAAGARAQSAMTAEGFVMAMENIFLHDDLADYRYTMEALRLELLPNPVKAVFNSKNELIGSAVYLNLIRIPSEYERRNFLYSIFYPVKRQICRAGLVLYLDEKKLCVHQNEIEAKFGVVQSRFRSPHSNADGFSYESRHALNVFFDYSMSDECLISVWLQQEKSEDKK